MSAAGRPPAPDPPSFSIHSYFLNAVISCYYYYFFYLNCSFELFVSISSDFSYLFFLSSRFSPFYYYYFFFTFISFFTTTPPPAPKLSVVVVSPPPLCGAPFIAAAELRPRGRRLHRSLSERGDKRRDANTKRRERGAGGGEEKAPNLEIEREGNFAQLQKAVNNDNERGEEAKQGNYGVFPARMERFGK